MHGHGNADELRLTDSDVVERFDRYIQTARLISGLLQESRGLRDPERLVPEFVAGDQKNGAHVPQGYTNRWRASVVLHVMANSTRIAGDRLLLFWTAGAFYVSQRRRRNLSQGQKPVGAPIAPEMQWVKWLGAEGG